tara:strand:+ start:1597 stop:2241 length:645 start_codon:yes stop_codon:yes gene_type:complete
MSKVLILGSTGLVGKYVLQEVVKSDRFSSVTALVREKQFHSEGKVKEIVFDFKNQLLLESLQPVHHVFCCLGTTIKKAGSKKNFRFVDYDLPLRFAKWAEQTKAESFSIITSMGADAMSNFFYNKVKGEIEDEIIKLNIPTIKIFRPSLIMGKRDELRIGELIGKTIFFFVNPIMIGSAKKYKGIKAKMIAKGMIYHLNKNQKGLTIINSDEIY